MWFTCVVDFIFLMDSIDPDSIVLYVLENTTIQ